MSPWNWIQEFSISLPEKIDLPLLLMAMAGLFLLRLLFQSIRIFILYLMALNPFWGKITRIIRCADGDTLIVGRKKGRRYKIRLIGVDTPESLRSLYQDVMPYGKEATAYTRKRLAPGKRVILLFDRQLVDSFGRYLAYVYLGNGEFFNATLVRKGYAFARSYPPNTRHDAFFKKLERKVKRRKRRIWSIYLSRDELRNRYLRSRNYRQFRKQHGSFG